MVWTLLAYEQKALALETFLLFSLCSYPHCPVMYIQEADNSNYCVCKSLQAQIQFLLVSKHAEGLGY